MRILAYSSKRCFAYDLVELLAWLYISQVCNVNHEITLSIFCVLHEVAWWHPYRDHRAALAATVQSCSSLQSLPPAMPAKIIFIQEHDPAVIASHQWVTRKTLHEFLMKCDMPDKPGHVTLKFFPMLLCLLISPVYSHVMMKSNLVSYTWLACRYQETIYFGL